jgi:hypothetical protein
MIKLLFISAALIVWDPPSNIDVMPVGFYIGYHSSSINGPFVESFRTDETNHVLGSLQSGNHFFFVTAVGTNGFESDPSNKVFEPVINPPRNSVIRIITP